MTAQPQRTVETTGGGPSARADSHPPPSNPRFEYFDSLRAIAVVAILVHHVPYFIGTQFNAWYSAFSARLNVGVTLFFVISGFLLYRPYAVSMLGGPPAPSASVYAGRRALRILPAYWLALTLLGVWPGLSGVFESEWWALYGLLQSYSLDWLFEGIRPAWSLSVEVAFYVLLPFLAHALARAGRRLDRGRRLRLQLVTLACFGAFGLGYRAFTFHQHSLVFLGTTLPAFLLWFAVGMSVAVLSAWYEGREREWGPTRWLATHSGCLWAIALGVLVAMSLSDAFPRPFSNDPQTMASHLGEHVLYALVALLVMLPAVFGEREGGLPRRLMGAHAFRWLGRISYGLFLWHSPLLSALQLRGWSELIPTFPFVSLTLFGVPVVIACAWLSWRLVEHPAHRLAHARRSDRGPVRSETQ